MEFFFFFFFLWLCFFSWNLLCGLAWNTALVSEPALLIAASIMSNDLWKQVCIFTCSFSWILDSSSRCSQHKIFSISITLEYFQLNWLKWFCFLTLVGGPLVILIGWIIYQPAFVEVIRMSFSMVSFLFQLDSGIPRLQNAFLYEVVSI